jgi:hypothetical protein
MSNVPPQLSRHSHRRNISSAPCVCGVRTSPIVANGSFPLGFVVALTEKFNLPFDEECKNLEPHAKKLEPRVFWIRVHFNVTIGGGHAQRLHCKLDNTFRFTL